MRGLLFVLTALVFGSAITDVHAIEITNVKTGLACIKTEVRAGSPGFVCHPTEDIFVVDQGSCVYDKREVPCTWTGIEFDYKNAEPGTKLVCTVTSSMPTLEGNPDGAAKSSVKEFTFELPLDKGTGHRFEAQYVVFELHDSSATEAIENTTCRVGGDIVISYRQKFHFPSLP